MGNCEPCRDSHVGVLAGHHSRLRRLLNRVSTGRAITNVIYPDLCEPDAPTKEWVSKAGTVAIDLGPCGLPPQPAAGSTAQGIDGAQDQSVGIGVNGSETAASGQNGAPVT